MVTRTNFWNDTYVAERSGPERNRNACYSHIEEGPSFDELVEAVKKRKTVTFRLVDFSGGYGLPPRDYKVRLIKFTIDCFNGYLLEGILYLLDEGECGYNFLARYHSDKDKLQLSYAVWADRRRKFHWSDGFKK